MTPGQIFRQAAMQLPIYDKEFRHIFQPATLYRVLREAERDVILDTHCVTKARQVTATVGERGIELEDDVLLPVTVRVAEPNDSADFEGWPVEMVDIGDIDNFGGV